MYFLNFEKKTNHYKIREYLFDFDDKTALEYVINYKKIVINRALIYSVKYVKTMILYL
jgi:hypothetical protein